MKVPGCPQRSPLSPRGRTRGGRWPSSTPCASPCWSSPSSRLSLRSQTLRFGLGALPGCKSVCSRIKRRDQNNERPTLSGFSLAFLPSKVEKPRPDFCLRKEGYDCGLADTCRLANWQIPADTIGAVGRLNAGVSLSHQTTWAEAAREADSTLERGGWVAGWGLGTCKGGQED